MVKQKVVLVKFWRHANTLYSMGAEARDRHMSGSPAGCRSAPASLPPLNDFFNAMCADSSRSPSRLVAPLRASPRSAASEAVLQGAAELAIGLQMKVRQQVAQGSEQAECVRWRQVATEASTLTVENSGSMASGSDGGVKQGAVAGSLAVGAQRAAACSHAPAVTWEAGQCDSR